MKDEGDAARPAEARPDGDVSASNAFAHDDVGLSLSFEDFYEIEHGRLFGALGLITGDRHEAEDLMQEAFLRVWERWHLVQSLASPTGYLYRTAMNVFRMRRRRALVASRRAARGLLRRDMEDEAEARYEIDRGLAELSPRQRAAVVLTELLDFSSSEAAASLGVKPATVRKLAQQGRDSLRKMLGAPSGEGSAGE